MRHRGLETSKSYSDGTTFYLSDYTIGMDVRTAYLAYPANTGRMISLTRESYVQHGVKHFWAFTYDGWYLATDTEGIVYFTKEFTSECYWDNA